MVFTLTTTIQQSLEALATAIGWEKERKGIQVGREAVMILSIENPNDPTQKLLEPINKFSKVQD